MLRITSILLLSLSCIFGKSPANTPINPLNGYPVHSSKVPHPPQVSGQKAIFSTAPSDADILFNGDNLDSWQGAWTIKDGILVASKENLSTIANYRDCQLHIEYRIPKDREVKEQKGSNSGIFLMGLYEIQVLESHTNTTYADGQAAAIYGQYPPLVNASTPQGEWQSYDIIFNAPIYDGKKVIQPARVTVLHNGVLVHHAQEFAGPGTYRKVAKYPKSHPHEAPLMLQWHNDPVEYRNIWIRKLGSYPKK